MLASSLEGGSLFEALQEGKLRLQQRSTFTSEKKKQTLQQLSFLPVPLLCMIEITNEYFHIFLMRSQTGKVYLPLWNNQQNWELLALTAAFCPLYLLLTSLICKTHVRVTYTNLAREFHGVPSTWKSWCFLPSVLKSMLGLSPILLVLCFSYCILHKDNFLMDICRKFKVF